MCFWDAKRGEPTELTPGFSPPWPWWDHFPVPRSPFRDSVVSNYREKLSYTQCVVVGVSPAAATALAALFLIFSQWSIALSWPDERRKK